VSGEIGVKGNNKETDSESAFEVVELAIRSSKSLQQQLGDMLKLCRLSVIKEI